MKSLVKRLSSNSSLYFGLAILVTAYVACRQIISLYTLERWAFGDNGGHLTLQRLTDQGMSPNIEFAYSYGPGAVLLNSFWAAVFGSTPESFTALQVGIRVLTVVSLVVIAIRLVPKGPALILSILSIPFFFSFDHSAAHGCERLCVLVAAAIYSRERLGISIAFVGAAALFRPAAAVVVCAMMIALCAARTYLDSGCSWESVRNLVRRFSWLVGTQFVCLVIYGARFGLESYAKTVVPLSGMRMYSKIRSVFPFSDLMQYFPESQNWKGYVFGNPSHVIAVCLVAAMVFFFVFSIVLIWPRSAGAGDRQSDEQRVIVLIPLALVTAAIVFTYKTILYYQPVLWIVLPAAFLPGRGRIGKVVAIPAVMLAINVVASLSYSQIEFSEDLRHLLSGESHGMADVPEDLRNLLQFADGRELAARPIMGEVSLLDRVGIVVRDTPYWCLRPGFNLSDELARSSVDLDECACVCREDQSFMHDLSGFSDATRKKRFGRYVLYWRE